MAARARKIRLLLMDVDGVLTGGHIYLLPMPDGTAVEMKAFHSQDGAGLKMAVDAGLRTGVITGRQSPAMTRRAQEVGMEFVIQGRGEKLPAYEEILRAAGLRDAEVAYIGDDLPDLPVLQRVGLAIAVANAVAEVRRAAHYVTRRERRRRRRARSDRRHSEGAGEVALRGQASASAFCNSSSATSFFFCIFSSVFFLLFSSVFLLFPNSPKRQRILTFQ